jgi:hypothetical protein
MWGYMRICLAAWKLLRVHSDGQTDRRTGRKNFYKFRCERTRKCKPLSDYSFIYRTKPNILKLNIWSIKFLQIIPFLVVPDRKHTVSMRNTNRLILSRETVAIYSEENTNQIQSVWAKFKVSLNDRTSGAYYVLQRIKCCDPSRLYQLRVYYTYDHKFA